MRWIRRSYNNQLDRIDREQLFYVAHHTQIRIFGLGIVPAALENCCELQSGNSANRRSVKNTTAQSESDQTNLKWRHEVVLFRWLVSGRPTGVVRVMQE